MILLVKGSIKVGTSDCPVGTYPLSKPSLRRWPNGRGPRAVDGLVEILEATVQCASPDIHFFRKMGLERFNQNHPLWAKINCNTCLLVPHHLNMAWKDSVAVHLVVHCPRPKLVGAFGLSNLV